MLGASLVGSLVEVFMGIFYKYIRRFFPPLVVGGVLVTIGVNLLDTGAGSPGCGSPRNLAMGFLVLITIVLLQRFGKGLLKNSAILIALLLGYAVSALLGMVDPSSRPAISASLCRSSSG